MCHISEDGGQKSVLAGKLYLLSSGIRTDAHCPKWKPKTPTSYTGPPQAATSISWQTPGANTHQPT